MRILILSDVHSNWPALAAIQESFDACLFVGDLVDYGTNPVPCLNWLIANATAAVRGNHDHAVAQRIRSAGDRGFRRLAAACRDLHWQLLDANQLKFLGRLPLTKTIELDGRRFYLVHASPRDPLDEYVEESADAWERRLKGIDADIICVGHTHRPFAMQVGTQLLVNPGSVGQPRDGDPRASYAIYENGAVTIRRVAYDVEATIDQMRTVGLDPWVVELAGLVLRTGGAISREEMDAIR